MKSKRVSAKVFAAALIQACSSRMVVPHDVSDVRSAKLGLNPSANVMNVPIGRLKRNGANTTRYPACGSGARFHEP